MKPHAGCRSRGESLVALKELPLSDIGLFGATESEVTAGVGRMCKEVEILSSLSHPNIGEGGRARGGRNTGRGRGGRRDTALRACV